MRFVCFLVGVVFGILVCVSQISPKEVKKGKEFYMQGNVYKCLKTKTLK